jgi:hypothetical protein
MGFLKRIESVDLQKPVKFNPYYIQEEGTEKYRAFLILSQDNKKIDSGYTKENPNGLPQLEKKIVDNKEVWDSTEQMKFFETIINDKIRPNLPEIKQEEEKVEVAPEEAGPSETEEHPAEDENDDSLPF